jgi:hypothetical protein
MSGLEGDRVGAPGLGLAITFHKRDHRTTSHRDGQTQGNKNGIRQQKDRLEMNDNIFAVISKTIQTCMEEMRLNPPDPP